MDKLQRYNQRILAILGSLAILLLIFICGFILVQTLDVFGRNSGYAINQELMVEASTDKDGNKLRKKEISFLSPQRIDSINELYLIPVSLINLEIPEIIEVDGDGSFGILDRGSIFSKRTYYRNYNGNFVNFILYNQKVNFQEVIFDFKLFIEAYGAYHIDGNNYLFFKAVISDSNQDGLLNENDLSSFYCYDVQTKSTTKIHYPNMGLISYELLSSSKDVILKFGMDKNKNGQINKYDEPKRLFIYSIKTHQAFPFVEQQKIDFMQKLID